MNWNDELPKLPLFVPSMYAFHNSRVVAYAPTFITATNLILSLTISQYHSTSSLLILYLTNHMCASTFACQIFHFNFHYITPYFGQNRFRSWCLSLDQAELVCFTVLTLCIVTE